VQLYAGIHHNSKISNFKTFLRCPNSDHSRAEVPKTETIFNRTLKFNDAAPFNSPCWDKGVESHMLQSSG
jgi:hypothetical protein